MQSEKPTLRAATSRGGPPSISRTTKVVRVSSEAASRQYASAASGCAAKNRRSSRKRLKVHDRLSGSNLRRGEPHTSPNCLIFPAEFEQNWQRGTVGAWLRHYRPDLQIPD